MARQTISRGASKVCERAVLLNSSPTSTSVTNPMFPSQSRKDISQWSPIKISRVPPRPLPREESHLARRITHTEWIPRCTSPPLSLSLAMIPWRCVGFGSFECNMGKRLRGQDCAPSSSDQPRISHTTYGTCGYEGLLCSVLPGHKQANEGGEI